MSIKRNEVIPFLAKQLKNQEFLNIRALDDNHPTPPGIVWEKGEIKHFPDLTATKGDAMGIFSVVENPTGISEREINKFKLFSAFAEQRHGKHFLVTEVETVDTLEKFCEQHALEVEILPIEKKS